MIESPYESRFAFLEDCLVHYVDEGTGPAILLIHGVPVWSYVFKDLILDLRADLRCVAPDLPGFGLSVASPSFGYGPADHEAVLSRLLPELGTGRVVVMGHDWGGPLALRLAVRHPDLVAGLVLGNTWAWPEHSVTAGEDWRGRVLRRAIAQDWIRTSRLFWRFGLRFAKPGLRLDRETERAYMAPFPTAESRRAPAELVRHNLLNASGKSSYMAELEADLPKLSGLPVLLTWGARCPAFRREERERFETLFPNHRAVVFPRGGHFVHQDEPFLVAAAIRTWMAEEGLLVS